MHQCHLENLLKHIFLGPIHRVSDIVCLEWSLRICIPNKFWAVATGLEKVSFHSNPKERQCQRMFKLPYNCTHFTCQLDYAQNPSSQASAVHELRTSRCTSWIQKRQRNQRSNCQHPLDHRKSKGIPNISSASLTTLKSLCGTQQTAEYS